VDAIYEVKNAAFSITAGTKTILNAIAGANQPISIIEWGVSFDGTTSTAVPETVELCQSTQAGVGTPGASPTPIQVGGKTITVQPTAGANYSAEPTTLTAIEGKYIPVFMGLYEKQLPLGQEPDTDLSGGTVKALAIRVTVAATVNGLAYIKFGIGG
jgi:hypothetical protein